MTKIKSLLTTFFIFTVGIFTGIASTIQWDLDSRGFLIVADHERRLTSEVLLLKMLDENKVDFSKQYLENDIKGDLETAHLATKFTVNPGMQALLERSIKIARTAISDRSKTYSELQKSQPFP